MNADSDPHGANPHANDIFPFARRSLPVVIVAAAVFTLTMVAIVVGLGRKPAYAVLYADLSPDAVPPITKRLAQDGIPYELTTAATGTTIRIPPTDLTAERNRLSGTAP